MKTSFVSTLSKPTVPPGKFNWASILPSKPLLRVQEVAKTLDCSVDHIYGLIDEGALTSVVDLRSRTARRSCPRILRESVLKFLELNSF